MAFLDVEISPEDVLHNWESMGKKFEDQTPNWPPGKHVGYHAMTFGFLVDQLVRRTDPKKRSLGNFFREEIALPFGNLIVI